jgi:HKD family nuclease
VRKKEEKLPHDKKPLKATPNILVADSPASFDLLKSLQAAKEVWIASAFAHKSGWAMIRDALLRSSAQLRLISGINFCQTEPSVLKDWISSASRQRDTRAHLYIGRETFHPKVFIVLSGSQPFALVGSGNLSAGGLHANIECFVYVSNARVINQIRSWLRELTEDKDRCIPLRPDDIKTYEKKWKAALKSRKNIEKQTSDAAREISAARHARMEHWRRAVSEARNYFRSSEFNGYDDQKKAARKILKLLHHPAYEFSRNEWSDFYDIWNMGHLIPVYKYRVFKQRGRLQKGLRLLAKRNMPIAERVDGILAPGGQTHVSHLGINAVSKILASMEPRKWPVWNNLAKLALSNFGYKVPRGVTPGQKYAAFADLMQEFIKETIAPDMLALDCFIYWKGRKTRESTGQ